MTIKKIKIKTNKLKRKKELFANMCVLGQCVNGLSPQKNGPCVYLGQMWQQYFRN